MPQPEDEEDQEDEKHEEEFVPDEDQKVGTTLDEDIELQRSLQTDRRNQMLKFKD